MIRASRFLVLVSASLLTLIVFSNAQTSEGRILGTIYDASGAVIAGAQITITNSATNLRRHLVTTSAGEYVAANLEPGSYSVEAEAHGFKKSVSSSLVLEVSRDLRVDLRLQPGAATEIRSEE